MRSRRRSRSPSLVSHESPPRKSFTPLLRCMKQLKKAAFRVLCYHSKPPGDVPCLGEEVLTACSSSSAIAKDKLSPQKFSVVGKQVLGLSQHIADLLGTLLPPSPITVTKVLGEAKISTRTWHRFWPRTPRVRRYHYVILWSSRPIYGHHRFFLIRCISDTNFANPHLQVEPDLHYSTMIA